MVELDMEEVESGIMVEFAVEMIIHASKHNNNNIIDQRIAIIHLDHATELLMKAFLIKEGYIINEINMDKIKNGVKKDSKFKDLMNDDKTIGFRDALRIVSRMINLDSENEKGIKDFHKLRNEIQHRALNISLNKSEAIRLFYPSLKELYVKMFPEDINIFPDF